MRAGAKERGAIVNKVGPVCIPRDVVVVAAVGFHFSPFLLVNRFALCITGLSSQRTRAVALVVGASRKGHHGAGNRNVARAVAKRRTAGRCFYLFIVSVFAAVSLFRSELCVCS